MASDETRDMERTPLYKTEAAKRAVKERWDHFMRAVDYIAKYINRDKTVPNIEETKDNLLDLQRSMEREIPEELVYGAFINMANAAHETWRKEKRSVQEMPAVPEEDVEARKMRAKITGVKNFTATPISKAKERRASSN